SRDEARWTADAGWRRRAAAGGGQGRRAASRELTSELTRHLRARADPRRAPSMTSWPSKITNRLTMKPERCRNRERQQGRRLHHLLELRRARRMPAACLVQSRSCIAAGWHFSPRGEV